MLIIQCTNNACTQYADNASSQHANNASTQYTENAYTEYADNARTHGIHHAVPSVIIVNYLSIMYKHLM